MPTLIPTLMTSERPRLVATLTGELTTCAWAPPAIWDLAGVTYMPEWLFGELIQAAKAGPVWLRLAPSCYVARKLLTYGLRDRLTEQPGGEWVLDLR